MFTHGIGEQESWVAEGHVFEEAVQLLAGEDTPRAAEVLSRLSLLEGVVVVEKTKNDVIFVGLRVGGIGF